MTRVVLIVPRIEVGGVFAVNRQLAVGLAEAGHQVCLLSIRSYDEKGVVAPHLVEFKSLERGRVIGSLLALRRLLKSKQVEVVIVSQIFLGVVAVVSGVGIRGSRLFVVEHSSVDYWRSSGRVKDRLALFIARVVLRFATGLVTVSEAGRDQWSRALRIRKSRVRFLPNPVLSGMEPLFLEGLPATERSGILFVGRLSDEKRVDLLLRAFAGLPAGSRDCLSIAGEGPNRSSLEDLARSLKIEREVSFLGEVSNVSELMKASRVLVLCSDVEGMPTVMIEALAHGCKVVSTDCRTGPREILDDGRFGSLVPVGDPVALASAIEGVDQFDIDHRALKSHLRKFVRTEAVRAYEEMFVGSTNGKGS